MNTTNLVLAILAIILAIIAAGCGFHNISHLHSILGVHTANALVVVQSVILLMVLGMMAWNAFKGNDKKAFTGSLLPITLIVFFLAMFYAHYILVTGRGMSNIVPTLISAGCSLIAIAYLSVSEFLKKTDTTATPSRKYRAWAAVALVAVIGLIPPALIMCNPNLSY